MSDKSMNICQCLIDSNKMNMWAEVLKNPKKYDLEMQEYALGKLQEGLLDFERRDCKEVHPFGMKEMPPQQKEAIEFFKGLDKNELPNLQPQLSDDKSQFRNYIYWITELAHNTFVYTEERNYCEK